MPKYISCKEHPMCIVSAFTFSLSLKVVLQYALLPLDCHCGMCLCSFSPSPLFHNCSRKLARISFVRQFLSTIASHSFVLNMDCMDGLAVAELCLLESCTIIDVLMSVYTVNSRRAVPYIGRYLLLWAWQVMDRGTGTQWASPFGWLDWH